MLNRYIVIINRLTKFIRILLHLLIDMVYMINVGGSDIKQPNYDEL